MRSSISSSRPVRGAAATLAVIAAAAVLSFTLYAALIAVWSPVVRSGQDQESDVTIAIEHFLYDRAAPEAAIVGSSQAERIPAAALGPDVANLAVAGANPLVGLDIIARSGRLPKRIYVEMNHLGQGTDAAFVDAVFAEPGHTLKRLVKALQTTYQPVNVVVSLLRRAARGRDDIYYPKITDAALHALLIERQRRLLAVPPDPAGLARDLAEIARLAVLFTAQETELVLFEMPIDPELEEAPAVVAVRRAARAAFPPGTSCWNEDAAPKGLYANDGLHVDSDTAARFGAGLAKTVCHPPQAQ